MAIVETGRVGSGTRVWAFAHILPGARIGKDCNICDGVFIENDVVVGDRVTIKCGVQIWDGIRLGDEVFVGPNATFTNDIYPRSKRHLSSYPITVVERGASIGANATVLPGIRIGEQAMVGAGAVVTHDVPSMARVVGNPARIVGYEDVGHTRRGIVAHARRDHHTTTERIRVRGVRWIRMKRVTDLRGCLVAGEMGVGLPFIPKRWFVVSDVPSSRVRGEHAHRRCRQLLVCLRGSLRVVADDGGHRQEFALDDPSRGLLIPAKTFCVHYGYTQDAMLLVVASHVYDPDDYIRDYSLFKTLARAKRQQ